eukprot:2791095-Rhodomonas_salina.1
MVIVLRTCDAVSGTDIAIALRQRCADAMCGTSIAVDVHSRVQCAVLTWRVRCTVVCKVLKNRDSHTD